MQWKKGTFMRTRTHYARSEQEHGYLLEDVFAVAKFGRGWGGFHIPTGLSVCTAPTKAGCQEIVERFLAVKPLEWWRALQEQPDSGSPQDVVDVMRKCAQLRRA